MIDRNTILNWNVLQAPWPLPDHSVDVIVTSPPYWGLRDYQHPDQIGQEETPEEYVRRLVDVFREAHRILKPTGTLWLNLADTYWGGKGQSGAGWSKENGGNIYGEAVNWSSKGQTRPQDRRHPLIKPKDLVGIPWTVALALRDAGWYLRQDIIWHKPNPMPESVTDRCTKSHEYIFMLTKSRSYYFDQDAIMQPAREGTNLRLDQELDQQEGSDRVPGKSNGKMKAVFQNAELANKKTVWTVTTKGFAGEFCTACRRYYEGKDKGLITTSTQIVNGREVTVSTCVCGRSDAWVAHFATFPEDLIVDCIKVSTSKAGNCASCGWPWARIKNTEDKTVGWGPGCGCQQPEVDKPIVLDLFMGAGTTGLVAMSQGRDFIGLELNPDYIDLARHRLKRKFGLFFNL